MNEPMRSTCSRLAIEQLISVYLQEVQQQEILLVKAGFEEQSFETFFGDSKLLHKYISDISNHQAIATLAKEVSVCEN